MTRVSETKGTVIQSFLKAIRDEKIAVFARGATHNLFITVIATFVGFLSTLVLTRVMGVENYGLYVYILSWFAVLSLTGQVGFQPALVRYFAAYTAQKDWSRARGVITYTTSVSLFVSLAVGTIAGVVVWYFSSNLGDAFAWAFLLGSPLIPLITVSALRSAALRALKRVVLYVVPDGIIRPILIALILGIISLGIKEPVTASNALLVNIVATFTVFAIGTILLLRALPTEVRIAHPVYQKREWWRTSLPMFFSTGMNQILAHADIIMVGTLLGPAEAGLYAVASRLAQLSLMGKNAADSITAPMISELYATEQRTHLARLVIISARGVTAFALSISLFLLLFGTPILELFGSAFTVVYLPLIILLAGFVFKASFASAGFLLSMTGHQDQSALVNGLSGAINIGLNLVLIPRFGLVGAAIATSVTNVLWSLGLLYYAQKYLKINPAAFAKVPASP